MTMLRRSDREIHDLLRDAVGVTEAPAGALAADVARRLEPDDLHAVCEALVDSDSRVQSLAGEVLGIMDAAAAAPRLGKLLLGRDLEVRRAAAVALGRCGVTGAAVLGEAMHSPDWDVRARAAETLGIVGQQDSVPPLCDALQDPVELVRIRAGRALGRIGCPTAVGPLCAALHDERDSVRIAALGALAAIGEPSAGRDVAAAALTSSWAVCQAAGETLRALPWEPVDGGQITLKALALGDEERIRTVGSAAIPALIAALEARTWELRHRAARAAAALAAEHPVPGLQAVANLLRKLVASRDPDARSVISDINHALTVVAAACRRASDLPLPSPAPDPDATTLPLPQAGGATQ
jgi:HEAT repeat protein